jgi:2,3-bisphosphoglycerate-dependent phosphoglycerate mutase
MQSVKLKSYLESNSLLYSMPYLVIIRHGQSEYNLQNRFTGQLDVLLTEYGIKEAKVAGRKLRKKHLHFDNFFTSGLKRAHETMNIVLDELKLPKNQTLVIQTNALNERNYGELQGLDKKETAARYSEKQVHEWRRGFASRPPGGESLEDTYGRVITYYKKSIEPLLKEGKNILIVAHGNSLRALMMYLEKIGRRKIEQIEIATGLPRMYSFTRRLRVENAEYL